LEIEYLEDMVKKEVKRDLNPYEQSNLAYAYGFLKGKMGDFMQKMEGKTTPIDTKDVEGFLKDIMKEKNTFKRGTDFDEYN